MCIVDRLFAALCVCSDSRSDFILGVVVADNIAYEKQLPYLSLLLEEVKANRSRSTVVVVVVAAVAAAHQKHPSLSISLRAAPLDLRLLLLFAALVQLARFLPQVGLATGALVEFTANPTTTLTTRRQ